MRNSILVTIFHSLNRDFTLNRDSLNRDFTVHRYFNETLTLPAAHARCKELGGNLAEPRSNDYLNSGNGQQWTDEKILLRAVLHQHGLNETTDIKVWTGKLNLGQCRWIGFQNGQVKSGYELCWKENTFFCEKIKGKKPIIK